jgi:uncharacterized protein YgbK (DUF1537 family)
LTRRWLILADDLSGAADAAVAFALRGLVTEVQWRDAPQPAATGSTGPVPDVIAFDTDSRRLAAAGAAERQRAALRRLRAPGMALFKKIDSTLRGQPAAEIAAIHHHDGARVIFAPANPAMGRSTRDGRVWVRGQPLEQTETWQRERSYANADLGEILAGARLPAVKLPLELVRAPARLAQVLRGTAGAPPVWICDAEDHADLANIARAGLLLDGTTLFAGTAGLAQALANQGEARRFSPLDLRPSRAGTLIVVGSLASNSRDAAARRAGVAGLRSVRVASELLRAGHSPELAPELARLGARVAASLAAGDDVLVEIAPEPRPDLASGPALARTLAAALEPARHVAGGLVVTGGETASALLDGWYFQRIRLIDEVAPGMSLGVALGDGRLPLITKPGAFGDAGSLVHALEALRRLRART